MSRYRTSIAASVVAGALLFAGCASSPAASEPAGEEKTLEIAFFSPVATNTYAAANLRGVEAAAEEIGANVTLFDAAFDATKQVSQVQDALTKGTYDIFVINPLNNAAMIPVAQKAIAQGVEVVSLMTTIGTDLDTLQSTVEGVITVGVPLGATGEYIGDLVIEACEDLDPCNVAYMPGDGAQATDQIRTTAVRETLATAPSVKLVSEQPGGFDQASGLAAMQNILTANPDLHVIAGASGQPIAGALQAIEQAGRTGQIVVVSNGATEEDVEGILSGAIFGAPLALPFSEGYEGTMLAYRALGGEKIERTVDVTAGSPFGPIATLETLSGSTGSGFVAEWTAG